MTPEQVQEEETVGMLAGMMGVDNDQARRVLRKHKGNVEKAADAMLSGDNGDEIPALWAPSTESSQDPGYADPFLADSQNATQSSSATVIDLTGDDSDSTRTLKLSEAQNDVKFGPSNRAPNPSWQMVTTNTPVENIDDRAMNEAIQASLADFGSTEELEMLPMEESVRDGGRPVALRTDASNIAHTALIIQALFQIPQVRHRVAQLYEPSSGEATQPLWRMQLVELFANLDLAQISAIVDKEVLPCLNPVSWDGTHLSLGDVSADFIKSFGEQVDSQLNAQTPEDEPAIRLFEFLHGRADSRGQSVKLLNRTTQNGSVVDISTGESPTPNDLISRLSSSLSHYNEITRTTTHDVIVEPADLVMFRLKPLQEASTGQGKSSNEPFAFPKEFYLDRFILDNLPVTLGKQVEEREKQDTINVLMKKKVFLTRNDQGRDVLTDLRASLYYFEEVAHNDEEEREESINRTANKLQVLLDSIVKTVSDIDVEVETLQKELSSVYDIPELQKHLYELRAVFMHTGLPGRKQIYSYIQDAHKIWWKTLDHTVTEVPEETVLTDPTGLHLGAGPYLLLYSRHLSDEDMTAPVAWPQSIVDPIEDSNRKFLAALSPIAEDEASPSRDAAVVSIPMAPYGGQPQAEDIEMQSQPQR